MRSAPKRHEWQGLFLEMAVVVIGILIAFALDSWWDGRAQALRERAHLRALRGDFAENVVRLEQATVREDAIVTASRQLLALIRRGGPVAMDTARVLMSRIFSSGRFSAVMGAYEAVVSSGGLAQISDDSLRAALADFASNLDAPYAEQYSNNLYFPFVREYAARIALLPDDPTAEDSPPELVQPVDREYMSLLGDPRFQGQIALRAYAERDVGEYYRTLHAQAERILSLLDRQTR